MGSDIEKTPKTGIYGELIYVRRSGRECLSS
jgi:hypothetical protein